ncbi:hypothetical protein BC832DRAFT_558448 [Gaertneriomyces semiglobifer]|nr:hypothetical protein BC832DRAFT_558448 [Gaertneriomyces semiglobifer]
MTRVHAAATPFAPRKNGSGRRILKSTATDVDYQDSNADDDAIAVTPALRNKSKNCNTESMVPLHFSGQENDADNEYPTTPRSTKKDKGKGRWTDPIIPSDPESTVDFTLYWHNGEVTSYWLDAFLRGDTSAPILEVYEHRKMIHGPRALFIPGAEFIPAGPRNSLPLYRAMDLVVLPEKMGEEEVEMLGGPEHFMRMVDLDYTMLPQCDNFANALHDQDLARFRRCAYAEASWCLAARQVC